MALVNIYGIIILNHISVLLKMEKNTEEEHIKQQVQFSKDYGKEEKDKEEAS